MSRKVLNFAPVQFAEESKSFGLYQIPYSKETLDSLRAEYNHTNSFFRDGETIYHSPMVAEGGFREGEYCMLDTVKDWKLAKSLIHSILLRKVIGIGFKPFGVHPIKFLARGNKHNLIRDFISPKDCSTIAFRRVFVVDTRVLVRDGIPQYGILLNCNYMWDIDVNCADLVAKGFNLKESYVLQKKTIDQDFQPKRVLVGKVLAVNNDVAIIEGPRGKLNISLDEIFIENSFKNRAKLVSHLTDDKVARQIEQFLRQGAGERNGAEGIANSLKDIYDFFLNAKFSNQIGFSFTARKFIDSGDQSWKEIEIPRTEYYFKDNKQEVSYNPDSGLVRYGPYSKFRDISSSPVIVVICRAKSMGTIDAFLSKLKNGIPGKEGAIERFEKGFVGIYRLSDVRFYYYEVENIEISSYEKAIHKANEEHPDSNLAIIETSDVFRKLPNNENPYLYCKGKFLNAGIPSQEFRLETMGKSDSDLRNVLNNACLAMYAKLGGLPWKISGAEKNQHQVVFGIGNKIFRHGRFGAGNRIVGIATIFSEDGEYLFGSKSRAVSYDQYFEEFKTTLRREVEFLQVGSGWLKGDTVRLVFHLFKPFRNREIAAIKDLLSDLESKYKLRYAFLTFSTYIPFFLIDSGQKGIASKYNHNQIRGKWQPERFSNLKLDDHHHLLQFIGPKQIKKYSDGYSPPILISLHPDSTFKDLDYLTRQAARFADNSWRSFFPGRLPVSIAYANEIANVLGRLQDVPQFDPGSIIDSRLHNKAWFL